MKYILAATVFAAFALNAFAGHVECGPGGCRWVRDPGDELIPISAPNTVAASDAIVGYRQQTSLIPVTRTEQYIEYQPVTKTRQVTEYQRQVEDVPIHASECQTCNYATACVDGTQVYVDASGQNYLGVDRRFHPIAGLARRAADVFFPNRAGIQHEASRGRNNCGCNGNCGQAGCTYR